MSNLLCFGCFVPVLFGFVLAFVCKGIGAVVSPQAIQGPQLLDFEKLVVLDLVFLHLCCIYVVFGLSYVGFVLDLCWHLCLRIDVEKQHFKKAFMRRLDLVPQSCKGPACCGDRKNPTWAQPSKPHNALTSETIRAAKVPARPLS